jgi:uncharacterized protein YjbI with pentapeptide repeats
MGHFKNLILMRRFLYHYLVLIFLIVFGLSGFNSIHAYDEIDLMNFRETKTCPRCDLQVAEFENMNLNLADLFGAKCTATRFDLANMQGAVLERAVLRAASFKKTYLEEANFKHARLQDADFEGAHLVNTNFEQANLTGANMNEAILIGASFSGAIWIDGEQCMPGSVGLCRK